MKEIDLKRAIQMRDYLKNSSGTDRSISNVELLAGMALLFCRMYLDQIINEMEKK